MYSRTMDAMTWYAKTTGDDTINAVATKAGLIYTTLSRQLHSHRLSPETVVAIARAYGRDTLDALIDHGLITEADLRSHGVRAALADATDREIADEVWRRLNDDQDHSTFDEPVGPRDTGFEVYDGDADAPHAAAAQGHDVDLDAEQEGSQDTP